MATKPARERSKSTRTQTSAIAKRNGARRTLPESEDRYRALFDRSLDAVYIHDLEGNFLDANDAALRLLGYSRDEILKLSFADLLDASQLPTALVVLQEIMKNGYQTKPTMFKLKRKDGTFVEVETVAAVITNESQPVAIQGIARDITERRRMEEALRKAKEELEHRVVERTAELENRNAELRREVAERKQAEEALRESEEKFRLLAENSTEVIWLLHPENYQVLYVNPAYEELWGRTCQSLYDEPRSWLSNIHPEDLERVLAALDKQAETGTFNEEFRIIRPDRSTRWVWDRGFAVRDESGQLYRVVGLAADITERKRLEEELQSAREALEGRVERKMLRKNPYGLTFREFTVLHHVAAGKADKEIAEELCISPLTVHKHVANILGKMNAASRTEAASRALREGLID